MSFDVQLQPVLDVAAEHAVSVDRDGRFPEEAIDSLRDSGLLGLTLPVAIGGLDGSPADFLSVSQALASRCASTAMIYLMHVCAAQVTLAATPDADSAALRSMADGTNLSTLAFSERGSRSHFWAPVSQLAGTMLSAEKSFVTAAGHAESYVVSTRPPDGLADRVEPLPGAQLGGGHRGRAGLGRARAPRDASAPMTFNVAVDDSMRLGEEGKGLDLMLGVVLPWFQLGQGAVSLGIAEAAQSAAVAHVTGAKLEHLGQTLADLPTVRARIGRAQTEVDTVAGFLADVARRMAEGDPQVPILSAKASANEMAIRVTSEAMQACGGVAMSRSLPIERSLRDARAGAVMSPTTDVLYELTGRALAGMPLL